jgi:hypothetical protein
LATEFIREQGEALVKLATFRTGGQDRIALVHGGDTKLFDLAAAAARNGCGLELGWYLEDNDEIELEVEKIGILKNKVVRQGA